MIRVLFVDDHQIVLDGISSLIKNEPNIEKIGEAVNGQEALEILNLIKVDIVVTDIHMPIMDGISLAKVITEDFPQVKTIILSMSSDLDLIKKAMQVGVSGFILKNKGKFELSMAIQRVFEGEEYFSREVIEKIMNKFKRNANDVAKLTKREIEVLRLIVKGLTSKEIANKLSRSESTINTHRKNLIEKTRVLNSQSLVKYAIDNGLI